MTGSDWHKAKAIFNSAMELPSEEREAYLANAYGTNEAVRKEVEKLLASYRSEFLDVPPEGNTNNLKFSAGAYVGRYEIVDLLGTGGMGEVYLANDDQLGRRVAIKILNSQYENKEANIQRFIQEAKAASALNHPNILTIHEIGQTDRSHYIVSEYIEGRTLRSTLESENPNLEKILDITIQIAGALAAAHSAHIVHRDIKPENIVLRDDGYVKVLDFGLAKLLPLPIGLEDETVKQNQTSKGLILGTVRYMSPEQARAGKVDERTDIFSLGVLLYEMVAGRTPFAGESTSDLFANLINKRPEPLSRFAQNVPDELERIVSKTLRKNPEERYQTMKGLTADLKELKERITLESKFPQTSQDSSNKATGFLPRTTGSVAATTGEPTLDRVKKYRYWPAMIAVPAVLLAALAIAWYWRSGTENSQPQIKSLAVLPLKSLDAGENYFGLGIADALIRRISQTGALTVRPTSAVRRYLNEDTDALTAARQLAADAVLEGSVQRANGRLRVSVNLLRTEDGVSFWADSFDMADADIFAIQDSVAQHIATRLKLHLDPRQQANLGERITNNPIAYEYYLKGLYNYDLRGLSEKDKPQAEATAELFKKAIEVDPNFALAHAQLANIYAWIAVYIEPSEIAWKERAEAELARAESLDPNIAEIHVARGALLSSAHYGWQTEAAIRELLEARRLNPHGAYGTLAGYYDHIGLENLAEREHRNALEVDPTGKWTKMEIRYYYSNSRRYDEYEAASRTYFPGEPLWSSFYVGKRRLDEAQAVIDVELSEDPNDPYALSDKAKLLALNGDRTGAESLIPQIMKGADRGKLTYHHIIYEVACNYALLGNANEAVKHLREADATGYSPYPLYERDSYLDPIRNTPEFIQFLAEMKPVYERRRREFK